MKIAVLTVSDTRTAKTDESGDVLQRRLQENGHALLERALCKDDIYQIRAIVSRWIGDPGVNAVLVTDGTGFSDRDNTPEALTPLFDKVVAVYGELFRHLSIASIGTSTVQSRAVAGLANRTLICAVPRSPRACVLARDDLIAPQLDSRHRTWNFVGHLMLAAETACAPRSPAQALG